MTPDRRIRTSLLSIGSDALLIAAKAALGWLTGSVALAADAMHSASDLGVSGVVLAGLLFRSRAEKQGGEGAAKSKRLCRIEAGLSYVIACLILYAPYEIVSTLLSRDEAPVRHLGIAVGGILGCIALTGVIARLKLQVGRETGSAALTADGYHSGTDFFSSIAVLLAVMGDAIGIRLDPIVAGVIALLIGVTGIELFAASARALILGEPLKTDDLGEGLAKAVRWLLHPPAAAEDPGESQGGAEASQAASEGGDLPSAPPSESKGVGVRRGLSALRPARLLTCLAAAVLLVWLCSGITAIQPDEVGVRVRLGRVAGPPLAPGLHAAFPRPFEEILRHKPSAVHRVEIGFRTGENGALNRLFDESTVIAGDESVAELNFVIHYREDDTLAALFRSRSADDIVRALAESAVREVMATETGDAILTHAQGRILERIRGRLKEELDAHALGLSLTDVLLTDVRPPSAVMPAFRDVFSAREDQLKVLRQAEAGRNDAIPKARAERTARIGEASSFETDKRLRSEGDAERFRLESSAAASSPEINAYRLFIETAEQGLAGRRKIIAAPEANFGGYQLWLFSPPQLSAPLAPDGRAGIRKTP